MENKDDKDFYCSLSKKELQELCRKCGLSPYMTKSNLVNALYSYFQMKNLRPISQVESSSVCSASLISPLDCGSQSDNMVHAPKDSYGNINRPRGKRNRKNHSQNIKCNEKGNFTGAESYHKASGFKLVQDLEYPLHDVGENFSLTCKKRDIYCSQNELGCNTNGFGYREKFPKVSFDNHDLSFAKDVGASNDPQIQSRSSSHDAHLEENVSTSSIKSSKAIPSFEFYVSSEEGINLIVDLNSSSSDWSKRLESEVGGCYNLRDNKFGSLREEVQLLGNSNKEMESSVLWNIDSDHKMDNRSVQAESSSCIDLPYGCNRSLRSSLIKPCNVVMEISTQLGKDNELLLVSSPNSAVAIHVTCDREYDRIGEEIIPLESSVMNTPQIKSLSNSVVSSTQEGPESLDLLEHQNLEVGDKTWVDLTLQNSCSNVGPSLVNPVSSSTGSMELQSSEVAILQRDVSCSPCKNTNLFEVVDPMLNVETRDDELSCSSTFQDHISTCADEPERTKVINGAETSESLQFAMSLEKTSEDSEADRVLKREMQHSDGEYLNCLDELNATILASRKHLVR